ncbi:MAG TPA: T9SS type A sorting domain-containing protein [Bacteroidia bacterium]|nr:T9SS type A sorting domain-containing protein [Bacteroidia bacterium]
MKLKILLSLLLLSVGLTGFCTTWTITNFGFTFTPAFITINPGDSVNFVIDSAHNAVEVSDTTWNANGNTALAGGFLTPFGGGLVLGAQLGTGTHYYVCYPHAANGMKGTITVQNPAGINGIYSGNQVNVFPNPVSSSVQLSIAENLNHDVTGKIFSSDGRLVKSFIIPAQEKIVQLDFSDFANGIYAIRINNDKNIFTKTIIKQ